MPAVCQATAKTGPDATRNLAPLREPLIRASAQPAVLSPLEQSSRDAALETPEDVQAILGLTAAGWGRRRIARELGCSPETVRKYRRQGGWEAYGKPRRIGVLDGQYDWLKERFLAHNGNADVVRQELASEKGIAVSLRTVERAVEPWRQELRAAALATVRFETPPGKQLQADFGETYARIAGERAKVHLCVLTLGYSRRLVVRAYRHERQVNWLLAMEEAFRHWRGVPAEVLFDNARALVKEHDPARQVLVFNERLDAFARYWGFLPKACRPYRARTKGKDERGVGYVKTNAVAGREFASWEALEAHLERWSREVADVRIHGTTGEQPLLRFQREEAAALQPLPHKPSFLAERELVRVVHNDACVEVEGNWYSVPWALLKQRVSVLVGDQQVQIRHGGRVVARHGRVAANRRHRSVLRGHWDGLVPAPQQDLAERSLPSADGALCVGPASTTSPPCGGGTRRRAPVVRSSELARSLAVYAAEVGEEVAA
jgi:transposase